MTGDKLLFKTLKEKVGDYVTFGDGSHAQVLDKRDYQDIWITSIERYVIHKRAEGKSSKHHLNL